MNFSRYLFIDEKRSTTVKKRGQQKNKQDLVLQKVSGIEKKLSFLGKVESRIEREEQEVLKKETEIKQKEERIERDLFTIGKFTFKRKHFLEIIRGTAGAFLGVGLGRNILNLDALAKSLPWWNIFGLLTFILLISSLLIYKNEQDFIKKKGRGIVFQKLITLYVISLVVEFIALWLFGALVPEATILIKTLIIGSYAAMAGAVSFTLI